ncbi:MAG: precorrin-6A reductase [Thermotaleaceae bacterium]
MIMVLSGTQDGREIINLLSEKKYPLLITTATSYGGSLIPESATGYVRTGKMNYEEMNTCIEENRVRLIIDATHPYAEEVSKNAMAISEEKTIPYLRFQRNESAYQDYEKIIRTVKDMQEATAYLKSIEGNIMLTTGSKSLDVFAANIDVCRLYPRVLPSSEVLIKCEAMGIRTGNIIAMQGPFSKTMNIEMIKKYNIGILVTKDSGDIGGTLDKLEAARQCGCVVVMIQRPAIVYRNLFYNQKDLLFKVCELYEKILSHDGESGR